MDPKFAKRLELLRKEAESVRRQRLREEAPRAPERQHARRPRKQDFAVQGFQYDTYNHQIGLSVLTFNDAFRRTIRRHDLPDHPRPFSTYEPQLVVQLLGFYTLDETLAATNAFGPAVPLVVSDRSTISYDRKAYERLLRATPTSAVVDAFEERLGYRSVARDTLTPEEFTLLAANTDVEYAAFFAGDVGVTFADLNERFAVTATCTTPSRQDVGYLIGKLAHPAAYGEVGAIVDAAVRAFERVRANGPGPS